MWRSRQLLYVKLSQFNPQFEPVSLCEVLKKPKSIVTQAISTLTIQHALGVLHIFKPLIKGFYLRKQRNSLLSIKTSVVLAQ